MIIIRKYCNAKYLEHINTYVVISAVLSGITFLWSNDYGIATFLAASVFCFIIVTIKTKSLKKIVLYTLEHALISIILILVTITLVTKGSPLSWIQSTFGTGGYQTWYYGISESKSYYIFNADFSFLMIVQLLYVCYGLLKLIKHNASWSAIVRYAIPSLLNFTAFLATNEYRVLSSGDSNEVGLTILFITIIIETLNFLDASLRKTWNKKKVHNYIVALSLIISIAYIGESIQNQVLLFTFGERGRYEEKLGGYLRHYAQDLEKTTNWLNGATVFATYSSALEDITEQYQPSGTDYIIHVLGDFARESYLNCFNKGEFDYASIIRYDEVSWEYWVRNANWYFYRELYKSYEPVFANSYQTYWKKKSKIQNRTWDSNILVEQISNNKVRISVNCSEIKNGTIDLKLNYYLTKQDSILAKFNINQMVFIRQVSEQNFVHEDFVNHFLPAKGITNIPITLIDGYGVIELDSMPNECTSLSVLLAEVENIFPEPFEYIAVNSADVYDNKLIINVNNTAINQKILEENNIFYTQLGSINISNIEINETAIVIEGSLNEELAISIVEDIQKNNIIKFKQ